MSDGKFPQYKGIKKPPLSCQAVQSKQKALFYFPIFSYQDDLSAHLKPNTLPQIPPTKWASCEILSFTKIPFITSPPDKL